MTALRPAEVRRDVLRVHHDEAGHLGYKETDRVIRLRYFWEEMPTTIRQYLRRCTTCVATKPGAARKPAPLAARRPTAPWHTVSVDLMGPYLKTNNGKNSILVVTDTFSRSYTNDTNDGTPVTRYRIHAKLATRSSDGSRNLHTGFHPKWLGPYAIRHSGRVYTVDRDGTAASTEDPAPADLDTSGGESN